MIKLTRREQQVVDVLVAGNTKHSEIADVLGIKARTVQTHFTNIFNKLGIGNKTQLVLWAVNGGNDFDREN